MLILVDYQCLDLYLQCTHVRSNHCDDIIAKHTHTRVGRSIPMHYSCSRRLHVFMSSCFAGNFSEAGGRSTYTHTHTRAHTHTHTETHTHSILIHTHAHTHAHTHTCTRSPLFNHYVPVCVLPGRTFRSLCSC